MYSNWLNERTRDSESTELLAPVCVIRVGQHMYVASDHSRILALWQRGVQTVPVADGTVDFDALECIERRQWCEESQVDEIADLESRVVKDSEYESIWIRRCEDARQRLKTEPQHRLRIVIEEDGRAKSKICDEILRALPEWFGIEESIVEYVADVETLPFKDTVLSPSRSFLPSGLRPTSAS